MTRSSLESVVVAPGYFERAGEVICRIAGAHSEAEAVYLLRDATRRLGADVAIFGSFLREPAQLRFMLACDPEWLLEYERAVALNQDPWILYAAQCSEPVCASHMPITSHAQLEALALARRFGFESALVVPAPSAGGAARLGVLVLGSHKENFFESDGYTALKVMARSLSMELHEWWLSKSRRELIFRAQLTGVDLDLLRLEHRGLSTKEIARELRLSAHAIDNKFRRLSARLGVSSRRAAAALAATYALI